MEKQDQIIFIECDEISLFLAESLLEGTDFRGETHFFTEVEEALSFLKALVSSSVNSIRLMVSTKVLIVELELMQQVREVLNGYHCSVCLLSSMEGSSGEEKEIMRKMGVSCSIEKPLTEEKLSRALKEAEFTPCSDEKDKRK